MRTVAFPVFNRPRLLKETLESWAEVRGIDRWQLRFSIEDSPWQQEQYMLISQMFPRALVNLQMGVPPSLGRNLHYLLAKSFELSSFVVMAEDDLPVATDVLEYFEWADQKFVDNHAVALTCATGGDGNNDSALVCIEPYFYSCHVWGTWRDRWESFIGPTWDKDFATSNGTPGVESGWDWNLQRIIKRRGLWTLRPAASRATDIGAVGVHSTPAHLEATRPKNFVRERPLVQYKLTADPAL